MNKTINKTIFIFIDNNLKVKQGKQKNYNTLAIDLNKLNKKEYKLYLLNKLEQIQKNIKEKKRFNYTKKKRYFSDSVNHKTIGEYTSRIEVKIIQRNESEIKIINQLKTIIK